MAVGLLIGARSPAGLGTPLPPFLMNWAPKLQWPALVGVAVSLSCAWLAPRLLTALRSSAAVAGAAYLLALAIGLSISAARGGTSAWTHVFDLGPHGSFEAHREYLPALPELTRGVTY